MSILHKNLSDHEDFQESKFIRIRECQEGFCFSTSGPLLTWELKYIKPLIKWQNGKPKVKIQE